MTAKFFFTIHRMEAISNTMSSTKRMAKIPCVYKNGEIYAGSLVLQQALNFVTQNSLVRGKDP
ncbi:MAG: hypothetical protein ACYDG2_07350 [Ruminiclostridium sp.]